MSRYIGDYQEYAPIKFSIDEIVEQSIFEKNGGQVEVDPPALVGGVGAYDIVRYRLSSRALRNDLTKMGYDDYAYFHDNDVKKICARLGVFDRGSGQPVLNIRLIEKSKKQGVSEVLLSKVTRIPDEEIALILNEIGVPPSHNNSVVSKLAEQANCWFQDGTWVTKNPEFLIKVTYERMCFSVKPAARETIDVFLPEDPNYVLGGSGDEDTAYWAKAHYEDFGFEQLHKLSKTARPGFSSWMSKEVERVQVVRNGIEQEINGLRSIEPDEVEASGPRP